MFSYFFNNVITSGKYIITYLVRGEYTKEVEFEAKDKEDLQDKWKFFVASNGLKLMSITGVDMVVN